MKEPHHGVALQHVRAGAELDGGDPGPVEVQGISSLAISAIKKKVLSVLK